MPRVFEGRFDKVSGRYALVAGRFNDFITGRLVEGCLDALRRHGIDTDSEVDLHWVPGAYEIPLVCGKAAASGRYAAVVALGTVIRGSTPHFDYVAGEVSKGCATASMDSGVPVIFGVITTDSIEQAIERAGTKAGNKGYEAGMAALEMASLLRCMDED